MGRSREIPSIKTKNKISDRTRIAFLFLQKDVVKYKKDQVIGHRVTEHVLTKSTFTVNLHWWIILEVLKISQKQTIAFALGFM